MENFFLEPTTNKDFKKKVKRKNLKKFFIKRLIFALKTAYKIVIYTKKMIRFVKTLKNKALWKSILKIK